MKNIAKMLQNFYFWVFSFFDHSLMVFHPRWHSFMRQMQIMNDICCNKLCKQNNLQIRTNPDGHQNRSLRRQYERYNHDYIPFRQGGENLYSHQQQFNQDRQFPDLLPQQEPMDIDTSTCPLHQTNYHSGNKNGQFQKHQASLDRRTGPKFQRVNHLDQNSDEWL